MLKWQFSRAHGRQSQRELWRRFRRTGAERPCRRLRMSFRRTEHYGCYDNAGHRRDRIPWKPCGAAAIRARAKRCACLCARRADRARSTDLPAERVEGDLRDPSSLDRALAGVRTVFHVAADYRLWARDPREIYESNVKGTQNLLDAARRASVEKFVYTSTVATMAVPREGGLPTRGCDRSLGEMIGALQTLEVAGGAGGQRAAASGLPVVIVNPDDACGSGRLETDADGKDHRRFLEWTNARLRGYGIEFRAGGRCAAGHLAGRRARTHGRAVYSWRGRTLR